MHRYMIRATRKEYTTRPEYDRATYYEVVETTTIESFVEGDKPFVSATMTGPSSLIVALAAVERLNGVITEWTLHGWTERVQTYLLA